MNIQHIMRKKLELQSFASYFLKQKHCIKTIFHFKLNEEISFITRLKQKKFTQEIHEPSQDESGQHTEESSGSVNQLTHLAFDSEFGASQ